MEVAGVKKFVGLWGLGPFRWRGGGRPIAFIAQLYTSSRQIW